MIITQPKEAIGGFVNIRQGYPPETPWGNYNALGLVRGNRLVAGVIYNSHESGNVYMHVAAIGTNWLTPEFLFAAFDYPFNELQKRRVTGFIRSRNKKAVAFVERLGFKFEGRMREYFCDDDAVIYGMLREECRFLDMRKAA